MSVFTITEVVETRPFEIVTPGGANRFTRHFVARLNTLAPEDPGYPTAADLTNARSLIDDLWDQHDVAIREKLTSTSAFICRRIAFDPIPDTPHFDIKAEYETFANVCDVSNDEGFVVRPPFVRRQTQSADRMFDLYREGATIPTHGDPLSTADIAGTAVDQQGRPIAVPINTLEIQIDTLFDTTECFDSDASTLNYLNRRNDATCWGYPEGRLLFKSVVVSEVGPEWYQITYRIIADEYYHLRQVPKLDINGNVQLTGTSGVGQAADVYWFQPYKSKIDFTELFLPSEWDYLTRACS